MTKEDFMKIGIYQLIPLSAILVCIGLVLTAGGSDSDLLWGIISGPGIPGI
jgi:hypothetical protein